jgi:enoyl-CoA hydratase/carnithine racemase
MAGPTTLATLNFSIRGRVAHAVFSRPDTLNSLSEEALDDLGVVMRNVQGDPEVRALVISGEGDAFSVGLDDELLEKAYGDPEYFENVLTRLAAAFLSLESLDVPVVAQVSGQALGAGLELALACDMIVAADDAVIGDGQLAAGIVPGGGASIRLPRLIGVQRARELIYSGRSLSGKEAAALGVVLRSVPSAELDAAVTALVATLIDKPRPCLATAKRQINRGVGVDTPTGVEQERRELIRYLQEFSPDAVEGFRAQRDGREPSWA